MSQNPFILFVCEHGAAKSILAAVYFNRFAAERGLDVRALARGTHPDSELSLPTLQGLAADGLMPTESVPQALTPEEVESARRIITFCELPDTQTAPVTIERWDGVPPVSESYQRARDVIVERIQNMLNQ